MARALFAGASLSLTAALLACGLSFFGPFWLQNVKATEPVAADRQYLLLSNGGPTWTGNYSRGLWAECGARCQWFWEDGYRLQRNLFTPLKWHLATQVLYFVGAVLVLVSEILSRIQLCWKERSATYMIISGLLIFSFVCQLSALAVFGGGARNVYSAKCRPLENFQWESTSDVYFHWSYWIAIPGGLTTLASAIAFLLLGCGCRRMK